MAINRNAALTQFAASQQEKRQRAHQKSIEPVLARRHEIEKLRLASTAASAEAQKERDFESQQRTSAFERATSFISPFLSDDLGAGASGALSSAQTALEQTIESRGAQAQSRLSSVLAKRGIFRSGSGAAASAQLEGETEAQVAQSRAGFAESAATRRQKEKESRRSAALQALQAVGGGFN